MRSYTAIACAAVVCLAAATRGSSAEGQESRRTIWDGVFSDAQAARGQQAYRQSCAKCHAEDLLGTGNAPALVGEAFLGRFDRGTADDVVQTIRQTMPQEAPDSLGAAAYVDVVAYLFKANGSPAGAADLPVDRATLKEVLVTSKDERR